MLSFEKGTSKENVGKILNNFNFYIEVCSNEIHM